MAILDLGQRVQETDEAGVITQFFYDRLGNLIAVTNALGTADQSITRYKYDSFGNLVEQLNNLMPLARVGPTIDTLA